jgi:hypothetical protein
METETVAQAVSLDHYQVQEIRRALLIGLASFGEIERLENEQNLAKFLGSPWPESACPTHPTGSADTVSVFAEALRFIEE